MEQIFNSARGGSNHVPNPTNWVIAFSTTGDRIVLEFYSPQPLVLVLKYCRRTSVLTHPKLGEGIG